MMQIKIRNTSQNELPFYATEGASGMDVYADLEENLTLAPMQRVLVPTGLYVELAENTELQVRPRSGMAYKKGITVLNSPGTIDADYRGEIKVLLVNLSGESQKIEPGERVAQLVFAEIHKLQWQEVESLESSERGAGGFGSTGNK